ncbi:MAG: cytochrome d ubiquinol oxidase subunit II [Thermoactinomyces sp.]
MTQPTEASIAILLVWLFLYIYSMAGSVDFGASFWALVHAGKRSQASRLANRFLSPTWEVTNTILVMLVVMVVGFFPKAAFMLGTVLLFPVSIILVFVALRGTFMVLAYSAEGSEKGLRLVSGIAGLLVPALLISALPVTEGGFIRVVDGQAVFLFDKWISSPSVYLYMLFGLTSELFLSSLFLTSYSKGADSEAYSMYRKQAIWFGPVAIIVAVLTLLFLEPEANWLLQNLARQRNLFVLSFISFLLGYFLLCWKKGNLRLSMIFIALQYLLAAFAYGLAHLPYIVYPYLTVGEAFTNINTFYTLLKVLVIGIAILLPGFIVFWRFFLKDKGYLTTHE